MLRPVATLHRFRRLATWLAPLLLLVLVGVTAVEATHHHAGGDAHARCAVCVASSVSAAAAPSAPPAPVPVRSSARVVAAERPLVAVHGVAPGASRAPPLA